MDVQGIEWLALHCSAPPQDFDLLARPLSLRGAAGSADELPAGAGAVDMPGRDSERSSVLDKRQCSADSEDSMSHGGESFHKKVMWRISSKLFAVSGSTTPMASWDDFVGSTHFEVAIGIAIILNGIQMAFEIQHQGLKLGSSLNYGFYHNPDPWPGATYLFEGLGFFFGVIFTIEMTLKIMVLRLRFFCNAWNLFDMVVVAGWLVETLGETLQYTGRGIWGQSDGGSQTTEVRVVRQIRSFDALFLMTTAIQSSATVLFWACALLFMLQVLNALLLNQLLHMLYFGDDSYKEEARREVQDREYEAGGVEVGQGGLWWTV
ncbi:unnamed protein product [Prorocentrum cordatum]|uniref:Ion transport domain-containing protein n=1 Tax=Prorocentrum cordatum TaxID=2364126 RepID=A0ABN9S0E2_9DINO|nr:unnamed protein product [Polarella glacialis]